MAKSISTGIGQPALRTISAAAALAAATALLTGCGSGGAAKVDASPSPSVASSAPPSADPTAAASAAVLTAYRGMWAEEVKAFASGSLKDVNLEQYAGDKALADIKASAVYYQDNNQVFKGEPKLAPKVTAIDLSTTPNRATVEDCVDASNFLPVDKATGTPAKITDANRPYVQTSSVRIYAGRWVVMESTINRDKTC
ncbi:hypothetical protein OG689_41790 [Kitasatospora sp. NBC_00240]|uniref:hypothetical protein n=1 Tax=Kitasatospora sp. NBC_00240 TaxID=2903567 RepID=UPI0022581610|nr:hypothetical protein [Kitasatospora sp. NBC_00240]MCX5215691.1 hypothetical protein [Kitasatospora sp. NBC_00240]